jgi:hypothetical protein
LEAIFFSSSKEVLRMASSSTGPIANQPSTLPRSALARLAGPLALAAGGLFTLTELVAYTRYALIDLNALDGRAILLTDPIYTATTVVLFIAFCLLLLALIAVDRWQEHRAGALGVIGFSAAVIGTMFLAGDGWFEAFAAHWLAEVAPQILDKPSGLLPIGGFSSYTLFALGWAMFGLTSLRARVFPAIICLAIAVGGLVGFMALIPPYGVPLGLAITWLGLWMLRAKPATSEVPISATI